MAGQVKRWAVAALAIMALAGCGQPPATVPIRDADPALWVVRDADTRIYLFGTVHMLKPGLGWFDEGVKQAFDASSELVLETVVPGDAEMGALVAELGTQADGPALPDRLDPADAAAFR
ncbi:MAG: TraB/GumN family protein, partial [Sphingomonadales bacterium]